MKVMKMMKTTKKRKALRIHDPKKMMTTVVLVLVGVVLVVVFLVEVLAKKCRCEVEITARAEVAALVLERNSWKEAEICLITDCLWFFLSNGYLNMPILFSDLFCFLLYFFLMSYILHCSSTTRREKIDREPKRLSNIQELKLL